MIINERLSVRARRDEVAAFLGDVEKVSSCVPGVESVTRDDSGKYRAVLAIRVGPINARFNGELELDLSRSPAHLAAVASGRDRASGSSVQVKVSADLDEHMTGGATSTDVAVVADIVIRGRLGQFGHGVIKAIATQLAAEFGANVNDRLAAAGPRRPEDGVPTPPQPRRLSAFRLIFLWLRQVFRRHAHAGRGE